jgi:hypothetical protein
MTANGSKYIDEVLFFGQRRFYAELYLSNNPEERRVRPCIGPTGSIDLSDARSPESERRPRGGLSEIDQVF